MSQCVVPASKKKKISELREGETGRIVTAPIFRTREGDLFVAADAVAEMLKRWTQVWVTACEGGVSLETVRPIERMIGDGYCMSRKQNGSVTIGGHRMIPVVHCTTREE